MKRIGVFFLIVIFISLAFADFEIHNYSVETSYPLNQILTGEINVTIEDMDIDSVISSNKGHEATLRDLLEGNGAIYDCIPGDCSTGYNKLNGGSSLSLDLDAGDIKTFGFYVNGSRVDYPEISFEVSSDFDVSDVSPLTIYFFEDDENFWKFTNFSADPRAVRDPYYGDYNDGYAEVDPGIIGESVYCSELEIYETDKIQAGVDLDLNGGKGNLTFKLYNDVGIPVSDDYENGLSFDPNEGQNGVVFRSSEDAPFSTGIYYLCLESATKDENATYRMFVDKKSGYYSSFSYRGDEFQSAANGNKTKNYALFVQEAIYADADILEQLNFSDYLLEAESYLGTKYYNDCSSGCYFPFDVLSSVKQNFTVNNPSFSYWLNRESDRVSTEVYELKKVPARVSYSGVLDLSVLGLKMNKTGTHKFYIDDDGESEKLFEESMKITSAPLINGLFPDYIPAGINAKLVADIDYDGDFSSLTYEWDFGDGSTQTTNTNEVFHLYNNISEYDVKVTVNAGNLSNYYERKIVTINPKNYVNLIYDQLSISLNQSIDEIETFPTWLQKVLENSLDVLTTQDELSRIKREIDLAIEDDDYLAIAQKINDLDLPRSVFISEDYTVDFPFSDNIDISGIAEYNSDDLEPGREDDYSNAVANWQDANIDFTVTIKKVSLMRTSGIVQDILTVYTINLKETSSLYEDEYYFVIDLPRDQMVFKSDMANPKSYSEQTIFPINENSFSTEFYVLGDSTFDFYASPEIESLELDVDINENCNFNYICEDGEDYKTCRSDCKPVGLMILYILLAAIGILVIYTLIQVWYLKYYENALFQDKNRLYNLLMFVTAAQTKGMSREDIKKSLREKGWTSERIEFVIRRANGERIGLYEIIPISKILARSRKKKVLANKGLPPQRPVPLSGRGPLRMGMPPERPGAPPTAPPNMRGPPGASGPGMPPSRPFPRNGPSASATPNSQQQTERNINKDNSQDVNKGK